MPRLPTIRIEALARFAAQLRFESSEAARRQLARVEALCREILMDVAAGRANAVFPEDWLTFRITGLKADRATGETGAVLVREAVMGDLAALVQRLSSRAKLVSTQHEGPLWLSCAELMSRWGVTQRTVERISKRGVPARRVALGGGRERVVWSRVFVELAEAAGLVGDVGRGREARQRRGKRLGKSGRAAIRTEGSALREQGGLSLNQAAARAARTHGVSRQAARRILKTDPTRAWAGTPAKKQETEGSRRTNYRAERLERLRVLRGLDLSAPETPMFMRADAGEVLLSPEIVRSELHGATPLLAPQLLALASKARGLSKRDEVHAATAICYLLWRSRTTLAKVSQAHPSASAIDRIETDLRWASRVMIVLIQDGLPLVARTVAEAGTSSADVLNAAGVAGVRALVEAVQTFDPFKGGRIAGPASLSIGRAVAAAVQGHSVQGAGVGHRTRAISRRVDARVWNGEIGGWSGEAWRRFARADRDAIASLPERMRAVMAVRCGLDGRPPRTSAETALELGRREVQVIADERRVLARLGGV